MPLTAEEVVERHRVTQLGVRSRFLKELLRLWPLINVAKLDETAAAWINMIVDLILGARRESADAALGYYQTLRRIEYGHELEDEDLYRNFGQGNVGAIQASLFVTGPYAFRKRMEQGADFDWALEQSQVDVAGAASRHVLNGGRDMLMETAERDSAVTYYARATGPDPCAFCAMLASRGPVYVEETVTRTTKRSIRGAGRRYHDNCQCMPRPMFDDDPESGWTERSRRFERLWETSTEGYSGKDALNAFRRAYESGRRENAPTPT